MAERSPPVTVTSPVVPFQVKVSPGSAEKVNVIVAVSPALRVVRSLVMVTVGCALPLIWISFVLLAIL